MSTLLEIHQLLMLSTGHLPARWFQPTASMPSASSVTRHGMLLWVPDQPDEHARHYDGDDPDGDLDVLALRRFARAHGCDWILLDADGPHVKELPFCLW